MHQSPNENSSTQNAKCFMAQTTEVSYSTPTKTLDTNHDTTSPSVEDKNAPLTCFMTNLKGESKMYFESLLKQYLETHDLLEKKEKIEREYLDETSSLNVALE